MKYIIERIGWFLLIAIIGFACWNFGKWIGASHNRLPDLDKPIFVNTPYPLEYPRYIENPTFIDRIKWKTKRPYIIMPSDSIKDIGDYWLALSLTKKKDKVQVVCVKNDSFFVQKFQYVGQDFTWWAGKTYMESYIVEHRFGNPFHWTGLLVGCTCSYSEQLVINPYIETGLTAWRISTLIGATNQAVYVKGTIRLW